MGTMALYPNASADVWPGGTITFAVAIESAVGSGVLVQASRITIGIAASTAPDAGTGTPLSPTSVGIVNVAPGTYQYTWLPDFTVAPGSYLVTWNGNRSSDGLLFTYTQSVTVAAAVQPAPVPGVYATVAQYQAWSGDQFTPASVIAVKLQRASEDIDRALIGAVYQVDGDGLPAEPGLVDTLMRATCAQTQYLLAVNDDAGVKREFASTNVGGVSASRAAKTQGTALPPLAPRALSILNVSGVLGAAPLINW